MSKRHQYGKKRAVQCACEYNFTCGKCIDDHIDRLRAERTPS